MATEAPLPPAEPLDDAGWEVPAFDVVEFFPRRTAYCVCVPVINEGDRIARQLAKMQPMADLADILLLDGGSTDGSMACDRLEPRGVRALLTKRGPGRLSAQLRMGYAWALRQGYQGVVTIDGNDKDGPEALPRFLHALDDGADFVQGSRFLRGGRAINTPRGRLLAIRLLHAPLVSLGARQWFTDTTNGFRAYSRQLLLDPRVQPFREVFSTYELLAYLSMRAPRLGFRSCEVPVLRAYPANAPVPTKIHGWRGSVTLLQTLLAAIQGRFDPPA